MPRIASTRAGRSLVLVVLVLLTGMVGWRRAEDASAARAASAIQGAGPHAKAAAGSAPALTAGSGDGTYATDTTTDTAALLRLEGQVLDADEQPVGGAKVTLGDHRSVLSEADGSFAFDDLPAGDYDLIAVHDDGFAESQRVGLDDRSDPVTLSLVHGPTLIVHALDERGLPIAGAKIEISSRTFTTAAAGSVRFRGVDTGGVYIDITAEGRAHVHQRQRTGDDPHATVDCSFTLPAGSTVSGTVLDQDGHVVPDAWVELNAGATRANAFTDADGTWQIEHVASGDYVMHASSQLHISSGEVAVTHDGARATSGVVLRVEHGAEITGHVVDRAGRPLAGAQVVTSSHSDETNARGEFRLQGLDAEAYLVTATTKTQGAASQRIEVAHNQLVQVTFVLDTSSLAGIVLDNRGEPVDDAMVYARSEDTSTFTIDHSDPYGHFDLGGLPPGHYKITAQRPNSQLESVALDVDTTNRRIELRVPDRAGVTGRVLLDGAPLAHYRFALTEDPDHDRAIHIYDANGRFTARDAAPGSYYVIISAAGIATRVVPNVILRANQVLDLGDVTVTHGDE